MSTDFSTRVNRPKAALPAALPFWVSLGLIPLVWLGALKGGAWILLTPLMTWYLFSALDAVVGTTLDNADPQTDERAAVLAPGGHADLDARCSSSACSV